MILSDQCWLKDICKKYLNPEKDCECRNQNVFCLKLFKLDQLYTLSLLTEKQRARIPLYVDADGTDMEMFYYLSNIENEINQFVQQGKHLYIYSSKVGNGKTSWAIRLLQSYLNSIWYKCDIDCKVLFVSVPRFLLAVKDSFNNVNDYAEHIKKYVYTADIVVFDDIATKSATQFEHELLFGIIDSRIVNNKCNIYTSNLDYTGLVTSVGERIASRIFNTATTIQLNGVDKRALGANQ